MQIVLTEEFDNYWDIFDSDNDDKETYKSSKAELINMLFEDLRDIVAVDYEEIYIVLPDLLFNLVDCFDYTNEEEIYNTIRERTGMDINDLYISMPLDTQPSLPAKKTIYAIEKKYIDLFIRASEESNITLTSIEPASMSFIRCLANWSLDQPIVEMFPKQATIVSYSPVGGMFKTDAANLSQEHLATYTSLEEADNEVKSAYAQNNFAASKTFRAMRPDAEYIVLSEYIPILQIPAIKENLPKETMKFPDFIDSKLNISEQIHWMSVVGTLLQEYKREEALYDNAPSFLQITTANLLPAEAQTMARHKQWKQITTKVCRMAILILSIILIAEFAGICYFNSIKIPDVLQSDYNQAKNNNELLEKEMQIIKEAKINDQKVLEGFSSLLKVKPDGAGFINVTIGKIDLKSKKNDKWIQLNVVAKDQMIFQDFQSALMENKDFSGVIINSINADHNKIQTANITIGRRVAE